MQFADFEIPHFKYAEQKGLVSIIVPVYNTREVYLRECLDSILTQTFTNWEAILVNDGSTDDTGKTIDMYAEKDSRFIAIHKRNEGTLLARKTGLENSKGEFIANIDHDDIYNAQFLEKMYTKITETNADFTWCRCDRADYFASDYKWNTNISENVTMVFMDPQRMLWPTWNKLIKRKIYAKVHFPIMHIVSGEDPIQTLQIVFTSKSAAFVPENLYSHRPDGASSVLRPVPVLMFTIALHNVLEKLFNGTIPCNVKNAFYFGRNNAPAYSYFLLTGRERREFEKEIRPLLPGFIKHEKKLNLKICLFLANKGIEFPFKLREIIKRMIIYVKNRKKSK